MSIAFRAGNCLDVFGAEPDASFDAFVSDWPAGIAFMSREWDRDHGGRDAWIKRWAEVAALMKRKAKPGAYSLTWALPRTAHWTACALEDGGWQIQDVIVHVFGQGWPKGKSALKPAAEHWILAKNGGGGALQIDAARVARGAGDLRELMGGHTATVYSEKEPTLYTPHVGGSWPPNFVLSHECQSWYAPKDDLPEGVCAAIHSYYGVDEEVRALRRGIQGHAFRARPASFLRAGVRWASREGAPSAVGGPVVRGVREGVSGDPGMVQDGAPPVLLQGVQGDAGAGAVEPRERAHAGGAGADVGEGDGAVSAREVVAVEGWSLQVDRGLRVGDDLDAPAGSAGHGGADGAQVGQDVEVHPGAQDQRRGDARSPADSAGDRAPSKRRQGRQPAGKPARDVVRGALDRAPGCGEGTDRAAARGGGASRGGRRLEVIESLIPEGWRGYFEHVGDEACEERGARRVRGSAPASGPTLTGASSSAARGKFNGVESTPSYGEVQEVPAFDCLAACDCGASVLHPAGGETPRCVCGAAMWWACPVAEMDRQSGHSESPPIGSVCKLSRKQSAHTVSLPPMTLPNGHGDSGGASRFFPRFTYQAKSAGGERHAGCDHLLWRADKRSPFGFVRVTREEYEALPGDPEHETVRAAKNEYQQPARVRGNVHPTVKSLDLMRWLISLVLPPGGRLGDVTCGSGGTGIATALLNIERDLGASFLGSDICPEAIEIAEARFAWWQANTVRQEGLFGDATIIEPEAKKPAAPKEKPAAAPHKVDPRQRGLWE